MKTIIGTERPMVTVILGIVLFVLLPCMSHGAIPQKINYQGYLTNAVGVPVNGTVQMVFSIYEDPSGGSALWTETQNVSVTHGVYNVNLGDVTPINLAFDAQYYLGIKVGTDSEMTPRRVLTSVGYAYRAQTVENVGSHTHDASQITSGTFSEALIDTAIARDAEVTAAISTHTANVSAHHTRYTDVEAVAAIKAADGHNSGLDADLLDGQHASSFASSTHTHDSYGGWVDDGTVVRLATGTDRVGIGTSTPGASNKLEVNGYTVIGSNAKGIRMRTDGLGVDLESLGSALAINFNGADTHFNTLGGFVGFGGTVGFGGNVGIGTNTPQQRLHVQGTTMIGSDSKGLRMRTDGSYVDLETLGSNLAINYQNNRNTLLNLWGNVGIGTESPSQKLHVVGISRFDVGAGSINISTPQGSPGIIGYGNNGNRRDIRFYDWGMTLGASSSASAPADTVAITPGNVSFKGNVQILSASTGATLIELGEGLDYAEGFHVSDKDKVVPGSVLIIDSENPGKLKLSDSAYDTRVAGIVAGANGLSSAVRLGVGQFDYDVALAGRVYCNVDSSFGEIKPGDLLTTSPTPGYAMVVKDPPKAQGAILGKAMEKLPRGEKSQILVLVTLQ